MDVRRWDVLKSFIKHHGWTRGAEIGVWRGQTFFVLLEDCPKLELIGVDSWETSEPHEKDIEKGLSSWKSPADVRRFCNEVKSKAANYPNGTILHMRSDKAAQAVDDRSLDFVFIDGDHQEESVIEDVTLWRPKLREGGWVLGHDEQWPSVRRALVRLFGKWETYPDNVWAVPND